MSSSARLQLARQLLAMSLSIRSLIPPTMLSFLQAHAFPDLDLLRHETEAHTHPLQHTRAKRSGRSRRPVRHAGGAVLALVNTSIII